MYRYIRASWQSRSIIFFYSVVMAVINIFINRLARFVVNVHIYVEFLLNDIITANCILLFILDIYYFYFIFLLFFSTGHPWNSRLAIHIFIVDAMSILIQYAITSFPTMLATSFLVVLFASVCSLWIWLNKFSKTTSNSFYLASNSKITKLFKSVLTYVFLICLYFSNR